MSKIRFFVEALDLGREMPAPEVVFFDAADTLIYLPLSVGEHYRVVAMRFGVAPTAAALDEAFRAAWKSAPERVTTNGPRPDDDKDWWRTLVGRVFEAVLSPAEQRGFDLPAYFEEVYAHFAKPGVWAAFPDVTGALEELLANGHRLGVISNFDRRLRTVLNDLGLAKYFEHIVISSEVGADKPDPRIFSTALERFGISAGEACHIGDDPKRDWSAETIGLRVFQLERPRHTLHDAVSFIRLAARR